MGLFGGEPYQPFWGEPDASFDFCEENYMLLSFIAEPFNAFSNMFYVIAGLFCLYQASRITKETNRKSVHLTFYFQGGVVILIGLGSFCYHSTLRRFFQICDEMPMVIGILVILYSLFEIKFIKKLHNNGTGILLFRIGLLVVVILSFIGYIFLPYWLFIVSYIVLSFGVVLPLQYIIFGHIKEKDVRICFVLSWVYGILALFIWLSTEVFFCSYLRMFQLHTIWHLFTSMWCLYNMILAQWVYFSAAELLKDRPTYSYQFRLFFYIYPKVIVREVGGP